MKTPTKEQIEQVAKIIFFATREELLDLWDIGVIEDIKQQYREKAKAAIETWEKIRS